MKRNKCPTNVQFSSWKTYSIRNIYSYIFSLLIPYLGVKESMAESYDIAMLLRSGIGGSLRGL
jgi:hypothetical protein